MYLPALKLRRGDRDILECWTRSGTIEARMAKRARIVLMAAEGASNRDIGEVVDLHYNQVGLWRKRYEQAGLAGLGDEERPGRPPVYDHDDVLLLVKTVTEEPPEGATRWTMEALAEVMATHGVPISASQCWRICKALDLKPWQVESWMTSHDPDFWEKAADVCGLYLNPPENAIVWSVDEKTSIQAKARIGPSKPAVPGFAEKREFEYERNGTVVLLPASTSTKATSPVGSPARPAQTILSPSYGTSWTRRQRTLTWTASSTTWRPTRPTKWPNCSSSTLGCTCISRPLTPAG